MPKPTPKDDKPFLHRDGVLLVMSAAASGVLNHLSNGEQGGFATAYGALSVVLGGICVVILLGMLTDYLSESKNKKRKR